MIFKMAYSSILDSDLDIDSSLNKQNSDWTFDRRAGMLYVVARAVSVGTNGNGDNFTEDELRKAYKSFVGKGVFVNHASNDVEKKRGKIVDAKWTEDRGEIFIRCLMEINADAFPELARMIKSGMIDSVSMGLCIDMDKNPQFILQEDLTLKRYKNIEIGDKVVTYDGTTGVVVARGVEKYENLEAYKFSGLGINDVVISHDHKLLILRKACRKSGHQHLKNAVTKEQIEFVRQEVKKRRLEAGFSINKTRNMLGLSHQNYINFENNNFKIVKIKTLQKMCLLFNIEFGPVSDTKETYTEAKSINKGDYLLSPLYSKVEALDEVDINVAKLFGWYLAEGSKCDKNGLRLDLHQKEIIYADEIDALAKTIDPSCSVRHVLRKDAIARIVFINSKKIRTLVDKHIFGNAKNKHVSTQLLTMEPDKQLNLVGSYIDGDGCSVEKSRRNKAYNVDSKNAIQTSTASIYLCKQIPLMLERSGILTSFNSQLRTPAKNSVVKTNTIEHTIYIGATYAHLIKPFSHKASKIKNVSKGTKKAFIYKNFIATPILEIEKFNFNGNGYNIQVGSDENTNFEGNHSYVLNGIVSENCSVAYSTCSVCSNAAKTTKDYCNCIKFHKGGAFMGKQAYEINHNIEFIELSLVTVPADPQAKILEVFARKNGLDLQELMHKAASTNDPYFMEKIENNEAAIQKAVFKSVKRANQIRGIK